MIVKEFKRMSKKIEMDVEVSPSAGLDTDRLMKELGQFRRFHLTNYCLLALPVFVAALYSTNYVFLAADVPYRYFYWLVLKYCRQAEDLQHVERDSNYRFIKLFVLVHICAMWYEKSHYPLQLSPRSVPGGVHVSTLLVVIWTRSLTVFRLVHWPLCYGHFKISHLWDSLLKLIFFISISIFMHWYPSIMGVYNTRSAGNAPSH